MNQPVWIYKCQACCLTFAIEKMDGLFDVACPFCESGEDIGDGGTGFLTIQEEAGKVTEVMVTKALMDELHAQGWHFVTRQ